MKIRLRYAEIPPVRLLWFDFLRIILRKLFRLQIIFRRKQPLTLNDPLSFYSVVHNFSSAHLLCGDVYSHQYSARKIRREKLLPIFAIDLREFFTGFT